MKRTLQSTLMEDRWWRPAALRRAIVDWPVARSADAADPPKQFISVFAMLPFAAVAILLVTSTCPGDSGGTGRSIEAETDWKFSVWQNRASLDPGGVLTLWWNSSQSTPEKKGDHDTFTVLIEGATHGYLGFGLSPFTGTMAGADLVVAWVDGGSVPHVRDYWADQNGSPTLDAIQDWRILWSRENITHTSIVLTRPVVTGHSSDLPIEVGRTRIIYSWSTQDPNEAPHYHGKEQRGSNTLELLSKSTAPHRNQQCFCLVLGLSLYLRNRQGET